MELIIGDQVMELEQPSAEQIIEKMNEMLDDEHFFSHFIANGIEIYEEYETYLAERASEIQRLEVIVKTVHELINEILLSSEEYITRAKPEIRRLADTFYQNPSPSAWQELNQLLEGIQWLHQMVMTIDQTTKHPHNWGNYLTAVASIQTELSQLEDAIQRQDSVLIADIIQYEIYPFFEAMGNEILTTIDTEGYRHDLN